MSNLTLNPNNAPKTCDDINKTSFVSKIAKYAKITAVALGVIATVGAVVATAVPTFGASIGIAGAVAAGVLGLGGITARIKNLFSSTVAKPADMPREKVFQPTQTQISLESNLIERQATTKAAIKEIIFPDSQIKTSFTNDKFIPNLETLPEEKVFQPTQTQISLESNLIERQATTKATIKEIIFPDNQIKTSFTNDKFIPNLETLSEEDENPALESIETITTPSEVKFEEDSKEEELKEPPHSESKSSHVELDQNSISFSTARSNLIKNLFPKENESLLKDPNTVETKIKESGARFW